MKILSKFFALLLITCLLFSCDENSSIGSSITQEEVEIIVDSSFTITGNTIYCDKIKSRTLTQLLGRINAQGYGDLTSDVVTQFMPAGVIDTSGVNVDDIDSIK